MKDWLEAFENVTFHAKLGTQKERIDRIAALAREIAPAVGADPDLAERAARLAKADLSSEMVYEFPELQGLMGRYYAEAAGEAPEVAAAAQEHYSPLGPSDAVPTAPVSVAVALADKLDTLAGFWAIDEKPTGSKDPYALRRAGIGVVRLVLENNVAIHIDRPLDAQILRFQAALMGTALPADLLRRVVQDGFVNMDRAALAAEHADAPYASLVSPHDPSLSDDLLAFLHDRLKVHLRGENIRHDVIDACLSAPNADDLASLTARARALDAFLATEDGGNLLQGYRRATNILTQAEAQDGVEYSYGADPKLAETDEERALFDAMDTARPKIDAALDAEDFTAAMTALAALRAPIDAFFEAVQVNAENQIVRRNRLNLLHGIRDICARIADLSQVEG